MTRTLVTGATGLVGHAIVEALVARGRPVRALVRSPERARAALPGEVELVAGDVTDAASVLGAMRGMDAVYHAAGLPEQWRRDPEELDRVNVGGTRHVVQAALALGTPRVVYTSTIDVFRVDPGRDFDESAPLDDAPKGTAYERSKQAADDWMTRAQQKGLHVVFLHPGAVYGPGPAGSPGLNDLIRRLRDREAPALLPGGTPVVFSRDVGEAHVRAEERAASGSRFIVVDRYEELVHLAWAVARALGRERVPPVLPLPVARAAAWVGERVADVTGMPPLIPSGQLHFLQWKVRPRNARARRELDWQPTLLADGIRETLAYLERTRPRR